MLHIFTILIKLFSFCLALFGIYISLMWDDEVFYKILHVPSLILLSTGLLGMLFALNHFRDIFRLFVVLLTKTDTLIWQQIKYADTKMEDITKDFYKSGVLSLKSYIENKKMPESWRMTLSQMEAKVDPDDILMLLNRQVFKFENEIKNKLSILSEISILAPSLGMFGTILGLIKLLNNLEMRESLSQNMALALVTTLYGIFFSNIIINPLRTRLDNYRVSILKSYEQINFWLQIVKNKKPVFYINQDFTEKK